VVLTQAACLLGHANAAAYVIRE